MHPNIELNLALILFLPWYAILAALYWIYPRQPRTLARWLFDVLVLTLATLGTVASTHWSFRHADASIDAIWPQVLATSVSYGVFLAALTLACLLRHRFFTLPHAARHTVDTPAAPPSGTPQ